MTIMSAGSRPRMILLLAVLGVAAVAVALATPASLLVGTPLATGTTLDNINQHVQANKNQDGSVDPWQIQVGAQGATDVRVLRLELGAGGHSGWHSHPGLVIGTVKSGSVDVYDANCGKRTVTVGGVFIENDRVHGLITTPGSGAAELWLTFITKHNAPRRIDEAAPACAWTTPIP